MKLLLVFLIVILLSLQVRLWTGDGSVFEGVSLKDSIEEQKKNNMLLKERNEGLKAEVEDLKQGVEAIEERARSELGMIKDNETFYQVVDE